MEGKAAELFREELQKFTTATEELLISANKYAMIDMTEDEIADTERCADLSKEQQALNTRLEEVKRENFSLRASINAWQVTLKNKLDEFKEADLKLNEIYNEIWSERENFCLKAGKFNDEYGILSEWWEKQMELLSDLESLEKKRTRDEKCQQEIEKPEMEVCTLKKHPEELGKHDAEDEEHPEEEKNSQRNDDPEREPSQEDFHTKKVKSFRAEEQNKLFSMVDMKKVRLANRMKHHRFARGMVPREIKETHPLE